MGDYSQSMLNCGPMNNKFMFQVINSSIHAGPGGTVMKLSSVNLDCA